MAGLPGLFEPFANAPRQRVRMTPLRCRHVSASIKLIRAAACGLPDQHAIVFGGGTCQEVPLTALARAFRRVDLHDVEESTLDAAIMGVDPALRERIVPRRSEIFFLREPFLAEVDACLLRADTPRTAVATLVALAEGGMFERTFGREPDADLVVASCVLSRLGCGLEGQVAERFARRFPASGTAALRASRPWRRALLTLHHATQRAFIGALRACTCPGGRVFLSAAVQVGQVTTEADGSWSSAGWYRTTAERRLVSLIGSGWKILLEAQWPWVETSPGPEGQPGLVHRAEGLILAPD